jgi:hypothetical protein
MLNGKVLLRTIDASAKNSHTSPNDHRINAPKKPTV